AGRGEAEPQGADGRSREAVGEAVGGGEARPGRARGDGQAAQGERGPQGQRGVRRSRRAGGRRPRPGPAPRRGELPAVPPRVPGPLGEAMIAVILAAALLPGDARNAARLYRLHCVGCHAADGTPTPTGKSFGAPMLKDAALIAGRRDDELISFLLEGTPRHPPPGTALTLLDAADLLAFLRAGLPSISDLFPDAAAYTAKTYTLQGPALVWAEALAGEELGADEKSLTVFAVYSGEPPPTGPRLVPQDPVQLDELSPKARRGYVVFGWLQGAPVAMALGADLSVVRLLSPNPQVAK